MTAEFLTEAILTQYEKTTKEMIRSEESLKRVLTEDEYFERYIRTIAEPLQDVDTEIYESFLKIAQREKDVILNEGEIVNDGKALAIAYLFYPMLADVYAKPVLTKLPTIWTTDNPKIQIDYRRYIAEVIDVNGKVTRTEEVPSPTLLRPSTIPFSVTGNSSISVTDIIQGIEPDAVRLNMAYTKIIQVIWNNGKSNQTANVLIRPNYDGKFEGYVTVDDGNGNKGTIKITGSVNPEKNTIDVAGVVLSGATGTVKYVGVNGVTSVTFLEDAKATVKIRPDIERKFSFRVEPNNDFMIETDTFQINEYKDLYNIDYIASAMQAVRSQLQLNKEAEIADELQSAEPIMASYGSVRVIDFANPPINLQAATVYDYFTLIVPKIVGLARQIEKVSRVLPQYILAAPETAAFLEMLQAVAVRFTQGNGAAPGSGVLGPTVASNISYARFKIIVSQALPEGKIYLLHKSNVLQNATLVDFIYKPLIIVDWSKKLRQQKFIITETKMLLLKPKNVGYIEFTGDSWKQLI